MAGRKFLIRSNSLSFKGIWSSRGDFFSKLTHFSKHTADIPPLSESIWAVSGAFIGMGILCFLSFIENINVLIAPFGASAIILFGIPEAPFAQPRNFLGGHILAAIVGVFIYQLFGNNWVTIASSTAITMAVMIATKTLHPPAGATALIAVATEQNWLFIILPVGAGVVILLLAAAIFNNLVKKYRYPT